MSTTGLTDVRAAYERVKGERDTLVEAVRPLLTRLEKMMENGPECDCPAEGHLCGWTDLNREIDAAQAALGDVSIMIPT